MEEVSIGLPIAAVTPGSEIKSLKIDQRCGRMIEIDFGGAHG